MTLRGGIGIHEKKACSVTRCLIVGFAVGLLTGFLGVGGGFLIVPALVLTAGLETPMAGGTSLAVIAMNSATGLLGQLRYVHEAFLPATLTARPMSDEQFAGSFRDN